MSKRKILFPITSRGNYGKLKNIIRSLQNDNNLECLVVVGGSVSLGKYGNLVGHIEANNIKVDEVVNFVVEGENLISMAKSGALAATEFASVISRYDPDIVVIVADRFECLPIAMCGRYLNKCIVHLEGGEVSGSVDDSIRHAISKLANYHFVCSDQSHENLLLQGESKEQIFVTGSTSFSEFTNADLSGLDFVRGLQKNVGLGPAIKMFPKEYGVCIFHPVTTEYKENYENCRELIKYINKEEMEFAWLWPNMDAGSDGISKAIRKSREENKMKNTHFFTSLPIEQYAPLLKFSKIIIGNSSSGIREAGFLGVPSVSIGNRQKGREKDSNVFLCQPRASDIELACFKAKKLASTNPSRIYDMKDASEVAANLLRTLPVVNDKFWKSPS